jgi:uncharacterized membrane protein YvbJ
MDIKSMRRISIVWGSILVILVVLLTAFGFLYKSKSNEYKKLEERLVESAKKYVDAKFLYPDDNKSVKITYQEMKENAFIEELKKDDDLCDGYVIVKSNGTVFNYKGYVSCPNYTSSNYEK